MIFNNQYQMVGSGSSGGCALTSILVSYSLQKPISQDLAMTGQISKDGKVGAVSGIYLKIDAAIEKGLKKVIIPLDNKIDFEALPSRIKDSIIVHFAETFQDIYNIAFLKCQWNQNFLLDYEICSKRINKIALLL